MSKPRIANKVHFVCNAHIDPAWQWVWQDGAAEAISTFRTAADLCEEFDGFIFNHNESMLYEWVEEFEPALFARIQKLVKQGKWHVIGGWYVQPDCNMPSGESLVRQALVGKSYFRRKFGVDVKIAANFDSFGHSRGLPQILRKSGYDYYVVLRPEKPRHHEELTSPLFRWIGFDGSELIVRRVGGGYATRVNLMKPLMEIWLREHPNPGTELMLWGVGDHGGGASRRDLLDMQELIDKTKDVQLVHSSLEGYFREMESVRGSLPVFRHDLNPTSIGCYTTMIRVKQKHRRLENEIYSLEKMATAAAVQGLIEYPKASIDAALKSLLFAQFHDMLPGSGIQDVEEDTLQLLDHGLELAAREKLKVFFALARGQQPAAVDNPPIMVYNPHPFAVRGLVECEFHLHDFNWTGTFFDAPVFRNGRMLPYQVEQERAAATLDWAKQVVFHADLKPGMNRFDTRLNELKKKPPVSLKPRNGRIRFKTAELEIIVNERTGLVDRWRVGGKDVTAPGAFQPIVLEDTPNPWGDGERYRGKLAGRFRLMPVKEGTAFSALPETVPSVRVIEDGPARTIIEAVFGWRRSAICQRYKLPKLGTEFEVETRVVWNEPYHVLKLSVPQAKPASGFLGQTAYGVQELPMDGAEAVSQKWQAVIAGDSEMAATCIDNGIYGSDLCKDTLRLTLLRSPSYSNSARTTVIKDRHNPVIDIGERTYRFWFNAGPVSERLAAIDREALAKNEMPYALSFFPPGGGKEPKPLAVLSDNAIQLAAAKPAEDASGDLILRLFNPTDRLRRTTLTLPHLRLKKRLLLKRYEILTLRVDVKTRKAVEANLIEEETT